MTVRTSSAEVAFIVLATVALSIPLCVAVRSAREKARLTTCQSTISMTVWGLQQYTHDWDECLPPARQLAAVQRQYVFPKYDYIEHCPSDYARQETSYAMPAVWSGRKLVDLEQRRGAILVYEADHGVPAYRHYRGMNVGYASERTRWRAEDTLTPEDILRGIDPNPEALPQDPWR